ncbi:MAG: hypothetical protein ABSG43_01050 [Solirubrobacteraceae bacterium]|jgi:hypothetical protein
MNPFDPLGSGGPLGPVIHGVTSIWKQIGGVILGTFKWTVTVAVKFILTTLAAVVQMLVKPLAGTGIDAMRFIVRVPDYAGQIAGPNGKLVYGFAGLNSLRDVMQWLGIAVLPWALTYATTRAITSEREPVAIPYRRVLIAVVLVASYGAWWSMAVAVANAVTGAVLSVPAVTDGLTKLMLYLTGGVALGGWQLVDLLMMLAIAVELLGLILAKVLVIAAGALLYATGPLMVGLVPTETGWGMARAWLSAAVMFLALPFLWACLFAVGAVLLDDSTTGGALVAGGSVFGQLIGGVLLAGAGFATLWMCIRIWRQAGGLLRMQVAGLLSVRANLRDDAGASRGRASTSTAGPGGVGGRVRAFGARVAAASGAGGRELAAASGGLGERVGAGVTAARTVGRRGLIGTAMIGGGRAGGRIAPGAASMVGGSRAGAVAVRMAKAGRASWQQTSSVQQAAALTHTRPRGGHGSTAATSSGAVRDADAGRRRDGNGDGGASAATGAGNGSRGRWRPRNGNGTPPTPPGVSSNGRNGGGRNGQAPRPASNGAPPSSSTLGRRRPATAGGSGARRPQTPRPASPPANGPQASPPPTSSRPPQRTTTTTPPPPARSITPPAAGSPRTPQQPQQLPATPPARRRLLSRKPNGNRKDAR